jgi:hypothetical protein
MSFAHALLPYGLGGKYERTNIETSFGLCPLDYWRKCDCEKKKKKKKETRSAGFHENGIGGVLSLRHLHLHATHSSYSCCFLVSPEGGISRSILSVPRFSIELQLEVDGKIVPKA